jgi:hypothetical protein
MEQKFWLTRKGIGLDRFALNQARIAHGRFLSWRAPIHQHHIEPALLQMQCGASADHAGTKDKDGMGHGV